VAGKTKSVQEDGAALAGGKGKPDDADRRRCCASSGGAGVAPAVI
jgi:hypothetical protein